MELGTRIHSQSDLRNAHRTQPQFATIHRTVHATVPRFACKDLVVKLIHPGGGSQSFLNMITLKYICWSLVEFLFTISSFGGLFSHSQTLLLLTKSYFLSSNVRAQCRNQCVTSAWQWSWPLLHVFYPNKNGAYAKCYEIVRYIAHKNKIWHTNIHNY